MLFALIQCEFLGIPCCREPARIQVVHARFITPGGIGGKIFQADRMADGCIAYTGLCDQCINQNLEVFDTTLPGNRDGERGRARQHGNDLCVHCQQGVVYLSDGRPR